jgi:hypothetical protein
LCRDSGFFSITWNVLSQRRRHGDVGPRDRARRAARDWLRWPCCAGRRSSRRASRRRPSARRRPWTCRPAIWRRQASRRACSYRGIELQNELYPEPQSLSFVPDGRLFGVSLRLRLDIDSVQLRSFASSSSRTSFHGLPERGFAA